MRRSIVTVGLAAAALLAACAFSAHKAPAQTPLPTVADAAAPQGRVPTKPFLNMPQTADGKIPPLLSETGAFTNVRDLVPAPGLMPYDLILAFWSDGAEKSRYVAIPDGKVTFSADGDWVFPRGTVFVKTFNLPTDTTGSKPVTRRLETRLLMIEGPGQVYGVTYKWRADLSDAELVGVDGLNEDIAIHSAAGVQTQDWGYPSRADCITCHNSNTAGELGPKTRQMNMAITYPDGTTENQLAHWSKLGIFSTTLSAQQISGFPVLAKADDTSRSLEDRARSFLDANCSQCHRPGGPPPGEFDTRYSTPLAQQNLINGHVNLTEGIDQPRVISPHDPSRSMIIRRLDTLDEARMPPIARHTIDAKDVAMLKEYILSLPGRDVLAAPTISPAGGDFVKPVSVTLASSDPSAQIHYTTDGSTPGASDPVYSKPITIDGPTVLRAKAIKDGMTSSVASQETYVIDN